MFLALTALKEYWTDTDSNNFSEILFLGNWCLSRSSYEEQNQLKEKVIPHLWNDPVKKEQAYQNTLKAYEIIFEDLKLFLENQLGLEKNNRFWQITIGEWLWRYIQIVYDRYNSLKSAYKNHPKLHAIILPEEDCHIPYNNRESVLKTLYDYSNLILYSQIIRINGFPHKIKPSSNKQNLKNEILPITTTVFSKSLKNRIKEKLIKTYHQFLPAPKIWFLHLNQFSNQLIKESIKHPFTFRPTFLQEVFYKHKINWQIRNQFQNYQDDDPFIQTCFRLMKFNLPICFLETIKQHIKNAEKLAKRKSKAILTQAGWRFNHESQFFIATQVTSGAKLIDAQHGGGYGLYKYDSMGNFEIKFSDYFLSWGWKNGQEKVLPLPFYLKFNNLSAEKKNTILYTGNLDLQYQSIFQATAIGPQIEQALEYQTAFFKAISPEVKKQTLLRLYPKDRGWNNKARLLANVDHLNFDDYSKSFEERLATAKLVIIDNNHTTLLQTLASNIPTIIFWDPKLWPLTKEAQFFFDQFKELKIWHDSPKSAADFLNNNIDNIEKWWHSEAIQEAVKAFNFSFARHSDDWLKDWKIELNKIIK